MQLCFQTFKSPIPRSRTDLASLVLFDDADDADDDDYDDDYVYNKNKNTSKY